jgi:hypothetical protein
MRDEIDQICNADEDQQEESFYKAIYPPYPSSNLRCLQESCNSVFTGRSRLNEVGCNRIVVK